jgi:hypothetical protein
MKEADAIAPDFATAHAIREAGSRFAQALAAAGHDPAPAFDLVENIAKSSVIEYVDMGRVFDEPLVEIRAKSGLVERAMPLFYPGCVNMLMGTDGVGKTFVALQAALEDLEAGYEVLWIDYEEQTDRTMKERLHAMHAKREWMSRFHVLRTDSILSQGNMKELLATATKCSLVVIDSVGEYLAAHGADENKDNDVAKWLNKHLSRYLAAAGPAVVLIDHPAKGNEGLEPAGSKRKRAGLTGAAYRISLPSESDGWSKEDGGFAVLTTAKDRHGNRRRGSIAAFIECVPQTQSQPLRIILTRDQPADLIMEEAEGGSRPVVVTAANNEERKRLIIQQLIDESVGPVSWVAAMDAVRAENIDITKKTAIKILEELDTRRAQQLSAVHSDPDD